MKIKSCFAKLLGLTVTSALALGCAFFPFAANTSLADEISSSGDSALLLPATYEEYLKFASAGDIAVQNGFVAISQGVNLYVYNGEVYKHYTHDKEIRSIDFTKDNKLLMLDLTDMYMVDFSGEELKLSKTPYGTKSAFAVTDGEGIYAAIAQTGTTTITYMVGTQSTIFETLTTNNVPVLFYEDGTLYVACGATLYTFQNGNRYSYSLPDAVKDMTVRNGLIYFTCDRGLYSFQTGQEPVLLKTPKASRTFSQISYDDGYLYISENSTLSGTILQYDLEKGDFTDYIITSSYDSDNRLRSSTAITQCNDTVYIADKNRLVVYDQNEKSYTSVSLSFTPSYLACNGSSILAASGVNYCLLDGVEFTTLYEGTLVGDVSGLACGYDEDYYISYSTSSLGELTTEDIAFHKIGDISLTSGANVRSIASNIFGDLYLLDMLGNVYSYQTSTPLLTATLNSAVHGFTVTRDNVFYGCTEGKIYYSSAVNQTKYISIDDKVTFNGSDELQNFTFDEASGDLYLLYDSCVVTKTQTAIPSLNNISAADCYSVVRSGNILGTVQINDNALGIGTDISLLKEEDIYLQETNYFRQKTCGAIVLNEIELDGESYYLTSAGGNSRLSLFRKKDCSQLQELVLTPIDQKMYITNDVELFMYPFISDLQYQKLAKNTQVTVLGNYETENGDYYYVSIGDTKGFVPKTFCNPINGQSPTYTDVLIGDDAKSLLRPFLGIILLLADLTMFVVYFVIKKKKTNK